MHIYTARARTIYGEYYVFNFAIKPTNRDVVTLIMESEQTGNLTVDYYLEITEITIEQSHVIDNTRWYK